MYQRPAQLQLQLKCQVCGDMFVSHGRNAKYCPVCAKRKKAEQDHNSWVRRKNTRKKKPDERLPEIEKLHMDFLGLDPYYYSVFKQVRRAAYRQWVREHLAEPLPESEQTEKK